MCVCCVLPVCTSVHFVHAEYPRGVAEVISFPGTGVKCGGKPPRVCWD